MSDFFKSAMGYFNGPPDNNSTWSASQGNGAAAAAVSGNGSSSSSNGPENDFVGQLVEVDGMKLRIRRLIAMGQSSL